MINQAIIKDGKNVLVVSKPTAKDYLISMNNQSMVVSEDMLKEVLDKTKEDLPTYQSIKG